MKQLRPALAGTTVTVTGRVVRPPMVRTPAIAALFEQARSLARDLGFEITESGSGGCSDGNFTAALGVPTLDGLGVVGDNSHAIDEYLLVDSMSARGALLGGLLRSWAVRC
jgi:glutamate carboxypeptidase